MSKIVDPYPRIHIRQLFLDFPKGNHPFGKPLRALSIRQPYLELMFRGKKKVEYRTRRISPDLMGVPFYLYSSKKEDLEAMRQYGFARGSLPTGVILGSAEIHSCLPGNEWGLWNWELSKVVQFAREDCRKPIGRPQPIWFWPFPQPYSTPSFIISKN